MKKPMTIIGLSSLIIGLILIAIPLYYEWQQAQKVEALEQAMTIVSRSEREPIDLSTIEHLPFSEAELEQVLELEIPAIGLEQKVLPETTEENLSISLTQIKPNQTPGEGNFTIAGHRGYRGERHFRNLPEVPIGAQVLLHQGNKTYTYQITTSDIIEATDIHILDDNEAKDEITMITCTIDGKQRIALKGELVE